MTTNDRAAEDGRRLTPAAVRGVEFSRANMLHPGYNDVEVDRFVHRLAEELARLIADKGELGDQVRALQKQLDGITRQAPPSEQAVQILAVAQQTADSYVAEAEEFSRQMASEAREQYQEQLRQARENAGAIIQAAQEAAAATAAKAEHGGDGNQRSVQELQEQAAYLTAFGQACRVELRLYLEALLTDVETEWGRADPASLPQPPLRTPAQRSDRDEQASLRTTEGAPAGGRRRGERSRRR
jgi:DivIVA domain-containing protein